MGQRLIKDNTAVDRATYTLPNKHYIPVDMKYIGVDNTSPFQFLASFLGKHQRANVMITGPLRKCLCRFRLQGVCVTNKNEGNDENGDIIVFSICLAD